MPPLAHGCARLGAGLEHDEGLLIRVKMGRSSQTHRAGANNRNW